MQASGLPTVADDSGIVVDALGGAPGVYSARYGGLGSDEERLYFLLENMKDVPEEQRTARFVSVITMLIPGHAALVARGECEGIITHAPCWRRRFWLRSHFLFPGGGDDLFSDQQPEKKPDFAPGKGPVPFRRITATGGISC